MKVEMALYYCERCGSVYCLQYLPSNPYICQYHLNVRGQDDVPLKMLYKVEPAPQSKAQGVERVG
ncbi:MAG: hypothetical protein KGI38_12280 [Thaumarchaeota archaeon]|nr:hypothetical protein [Nitrososphaerota archaeon]